MKVLTHLDPQVLEREFLQGIDRAHPTGSSGPTLVLVPTTRLVDHVQRRLSRQRRAWLGLDVVTPSAVARRILSAGGEDAEPALSTRLLDAFVRRILLGRPGNRWAQFVALRPGALPRLRSALADLREAGLAPGDVTRAAARGDDEDRALAEIYEHYSRSLDSQSEPRRSDEAGTIRAALDHAAAFGGRYAHVFVHGAYEWIGVHLDLIREVSRNSDTTVFLPGRRGARVAEYANAYARDFLPGSGRRPSALGDALPIEQRFDLAALYDEQASPRPAAAGRIAFRHCQGEAAEVKIAVRQALAAVHDGCPPTEIVITARSLEPYAAALEQAFEDEKLPWTSSLASPLRRHPAVRDFLLMLEIVGDDFPRRATAEWLRSPRVRFDALLSDGPPAGGQADIWSRGARIIGGLAEWTNDLPRWAAEPRLHGPHDDEERAKAVRAAEHRAGAARRIGRTLRALRDRVDPRPRTWSEHSVVLRDLLEAMFEDSGGQTEIAAREALSKRLEELPLMETVAGDDRLVPFAELRGWLADAVDSSELPLYQRDNGGIRVLDAMQLRGLTFKRVYFLGANSGLFPRPAREDPILGDRFREQLRRAARRPLPVKAAGNTEERLLLAGILGAADERIEVSWQRADESGKARTPSLALREIARVAYGRPDIPDVRRHARHLRSHPTQWLEDLVERPGLLASGEELLLGALEAVTPTAIESVAQRFPVIAPGVRMLRATQSFHIVDATFDGRVGPRPRPERLSVSALETLGCCPLQFFFNRTLGIRELDNQADALEIEPRELGTRIHAVLDRVYATLLAEGLLHRDATEKAIQRADELLALERGELLGPSGPRLARRLPVLFGQLTESWARALEAFVRADLSLRIGGGYSPGAFETEVSRTIDFGDGVEETVTGRLDRTLLRDDTTMVGDYKTSGNLGRRVQKIKMLRGQTLQVPLYRLLAGEAAQVELLGVSPAVEITDDGETGYRHVFSGFDNKEQNAGFLETVRTLVQLRRNGTFPLNDGKHCDWCAFTQSCRRKHPPTGDREDQAKDSLDYRLLGSKKTKLPTLASLRGDP